MGLAEKLMAGACPDIFDRGGTSGALTYAGVARDGLGVKIGPGL